MAFFSIIFVIMFVIFYLLFGFTPLNYFLPGNTVSSEQKKIIKLAGQVDSLSRVVETRERYLNNIQDILKGNVTDSMVKKKRPEEDLQVKSEDVKLAKRNKEDSLFRANFESRDPYKLEFNTRDNTNKLTNYTFFPPLKGMITSTYDESKGHYAIDIVGPEDIGIKSVLDGTVIFSEWSASTGYVIMVQHPNNLVSVYKHNSDLLKKVGNFVEGGEVISIIGESGELSTGPHLHFELWHKGSPVDPEEYISF